MIHEGKAPVLVSVQDGIAVITLNRPERQNAWTGEMGKLYAEALDTAGRDEAVRAIVVIGAGGHFSLGGDSEALTELVEEGALGVSQSNLSPWIAMTVSKPVIAAVGGVCCGVGLLQALYCDIRIAADDVKFSTAYVRRGLVAARGMSWLLPRLVGAGRAADLLYSGRVVRADEAERIGLANRVVPATDLLELTLDYARTIVAKSSPRALRGMKLQLQADLQCGFTESLDRAEVMLNDALASPDFAEGVKSWQERREPVFPSLASSLGHFDLVS